MHIRNRFSLFLVSLAIISALSFAAAGANPTGLSLFESIKEFFSITTVSDSSLANSKGVRGGENQAALDGEVVEPVFFVDPAILTWNTFGNLGTETTEPSTTNDTNIAATNLTIGPGVTPAANGNRFGGSNWFNTGDTNPSTLAQAVAGNDYIQFVVTPNPGFSFTPTSFVFNWDRSGSGPPNVALRSSVDGFASNLGTVAPTAAIATQNTITISGLTGITTATTFRVYGYGATATGGTGGFDIGSSVVNVQLNGTTTATGTTAPVVSSSAATSIATTSATLNGDITSDGGATVTDRGFVYRTTAGVAITDNPTTVAGTTGAYSVGISSLSVNTQYFFKAYAINSVNTSLSSEQNFWTLANTPTAPTVGSPTQTTLNVTIGSGDGNPATTVYAIQEAGGQYVQAGGTIGASAVYQTAATWATKTVTGLSSNTTYTFQVKAQNGAGVDTAFGLSSGATTSPGAPSVTTEAATDHTTTSATLNGTVTADGGAAITDRGFYWKTTSGVTISDTQISEGGTSVAAFTSSLAGLSVNTQYFYRAYAANSSGTTLGNSDVSFYTLANTPSAPTVDGATRSSLSVTLGSGDGNPTTTTYAIRETTTGNYVQANGSLGVTQVYQDASTWGTVAVSGLSSSTTYTFEVKAANGANTDTAFGTATNGTTLFAPPVLAAWDTSTLPGGTNNFGPSPFTATQTGTGVTVGGLTRGSGVVTSGSAAARGWGGLDWQNSSVANAISGNDFATFTVAPNSGKRVSFDSISKFAYRRSTTGATSGVLQYQIGSGSFTDITTLNYSSTSSSGSSLAAIDLSGVVALQNVNPGNTVTFRIVNFGGTSAGGTWYIFDTAISSANDLEVIGTVSDVSSVTYDANGGTGTQTDPFSPYATGSNVTVLGPGSIVRTGYSFAGWNTVADGSGTSYSPAATFAIAADTVLYAQWTINTYTITASAGTGGSISPSGVTVKNYGENQIYMITPDPGYAVLDVLADGNSVPLTAGTYEFSNIQANHTISATFVIANRTVTFNANGGTGTMAQQVASTATNLSANTFTRSGYSFTGWNTAPNGSGTSYADGGSFPFNSDATLYAQWITYRVFFEANTGTGFMASQNNVVATNLTANTFTKTGYTFDHWNTASDNSGTSYADGASYPFTADAVLYAQWLDSEVPVIATYTPITSSAVDTAKTLGVTVTDNVGVTAVAIFYVVGSGPESPVACVSSGVNTYDCTIPAPGLGNAVRYYVAAVDAVGNSSTNPSSASPNLYTIGGAAIPAGDYSNVSLAGGSSLGGNISVANVLDLSGVVTGGTFALALDCDATVTGAGATNYVDGSVLKSFCATSGTPFSYPVGQGAYSPVDVTITALATNPSSLTVRSYDATLAGFDPAQSLTRYWDLTETGELTADLSFRYDQSDVVGNESDYRVWRLESNSTITNLCSGGPCVDTTNNIIGPVLGVTTFSRWTGAGPLAPTAAEVSLAGRVLTANGQGIRNSVVVITGNSLPQPIRVVTGSFGYYKFDGLEAGEIYVVTVNSKRFMFSVPSRVVSVPDSITDLDFFALPQE